MPLEKEFRDQGDLILSERQVSESYKKDQRPGDEEDEESTCEME
jgi:hypothetical protein